MSDRRVKRPGSLLIVCLAFASMMTGCVADGPQPRAKPHIGPQPRDSQADVLLLNLGPPSDADGDTTPDTFIASVHIFDERYQLPVQVPGKMSFFLFAGDTETPLHAWSFEDRELQRQIIKAQVGPVYRFRLRVPIDAKPVREKFVTVQCIFEETDGSKAQAWHRDLPWLSFPR